MSKGIELVIRRSGAYIFNAVLLFLVLTPTAFLTESIFGIQPSSSDEVWIAAAISFSIPAWSYFLFSDLSWNGVTAGIRLLKVQVISTTSNEIQLGRALRRTPIKLLPWELAHIFGFALADKISKSAESAGLITGNL